MNLRRAFAIAFAVVLLIDVSANRVEARPLALSMEYDTEKRFGVGLALGVPFGASLKYMMTPAWAADLGIGGYYGYRDRDGFHLHGDLLWQPFVAVEGQTFLAPMYFGLGGRFLRHDEISHIGIRIPVGISFDLDDSPMDIFLETALVIDVIVDEGGGGAVDANGVVGIRYFF